MLVLLIKTKIMDLTVTQLLILFGIIMFVHTIAISILAFNNSAKIDSMKNKIDLMKDRIKDLEKTKKL